MGVTVWQKCLLSLEDELSSQQFSTWIRPLQAEPAIGEVKLLAPNRYIMDQVNEQFLNRIREIAKANGLDNVSLQIGSSTPISVEKKRPNKP